MFSVGADGDAEDVSAQFVPASVVADEIVKRLANNELSPAAGDYIRRIAQHGQVYWSTMLFGGYDAVRFEALANPDGSLRLTLEDVSCCPIWKTVLAGGVSGGH